MGSLYNLHWVQHHNCCRSWHISRQKIWPLFVTAQGHPRSNLMTPIESLWVLHTSALEGPTSYLSPFSRYFESKFWCWPFDLGRANPWAKVHQKGRWSTTNLVYHPVKFHPHGANSLRDVRYQIFFTFWPWVANPWAKVHQKGDDLPCYHLGLPSCQISSPCINPRLRYPLQEILRTYRQTDSKWYNPSTSIGMWG